jgi:hypothetical protein
MQQSLAVSIFPKAKAPGGCPKSVRVFCLGRTEKNEFLVSRRKPVFRIHGQNRRRVSTRHALQLQDPIIPDPSLQRIIIIAG